LEHTDGQKQATDQDRSEKTIPRKSLGG